MTATYDYFWHNWVTSSRVETRYRTEIVPSRDDGLEERIGQAERPYRAISLRWTGLNANEQSRIIYALWRSAGQRIYVPIYPDQQRTSASSAGGGTTINVPTASSRFSVGGQVLVVSRDGSTRERKTVQSFNGVSITTTAALANTYAAGSFVYPLILAEVQPRSDYTAITRSVGDVEATFVEVLSSDSIPASAGTDEPGDLGAETSDARDAVPEAPVLNLQPNFAVPVGSSIERPADRVDIGLGSILAPRGPRAAFGWEFGYLTFSKDAGADLLEFFDSRRGRLLPFYFVNPVIDWELSSIAVGPVDVTAPENGNVEDLQDSLEYVAVVLKNGTIHIRKVDGVTAGGGNWAISVAVDFPVIAAGDVARVTPAHFCRFARDELVQEARTGVVSFWRLSIVEVLGEAQASEIDVPAGAEYAADCELVDGDCTGDWTICHVAYLMDPRDISFDCSPCSIGFGFAHVTVAEEDNCEKDITVFLGLWDYFKRTIPSCGNPSVVGIPVPISNTQCEYVLAYAGDCTDLGMPACRAMRVFVSIKPGHSDPPDCACDGAIVADEDRHANCHSFEVDGAWFA